MVVTDLSLPRMLLRAVRASSLSRFSKYLSIETISVDVSEPESLFLFEVSEPESLFLFEVSEFPSVRFLMASKS